jgi:hypothetical protein
MQYQVILLTISFFQSAEADSKPCGQGQEAPNAHPELAKPTGRKAAPWDVAGKAAAFWEAHKWKIFMLVLLAAVGCGVGVWWYFTYGPGALVMDGVDGIPKEGGGGDGKTIPPKGGGGNGG